MTPRGAGTGLVGGAVPLLGGLVISTVRMNKILDYDMKNLCVRTQVGALRLQSGHLHVPYKEP